MSPINTNKMRFNFEELANFQNNKDNINKD